MKNVHYEIPLPLSRQLAADNNAMINYSAMTSQQKYDLHLKVNRCFSNSELTRIVRNLADGLF